ncbi:hypothetical protein E2C01_066621 [Portunus trituberculatus]|uniref:Uncharacterized protein n=1 Tax=Portunus trituberculatus TaxID=210409 RepID=A0A5B7HIM5_PORTR|nr:hypothetical protein [Portunus trituberculatus]
MWLFFRGRQDFSTGIWSGLRLLQVGVDCRCNICNPRFTAPLPPAAGCQLILPGNTTPRRGGGARLPRS